MTGNIKDKEAFERLNFLYQAAHCVLTQNPQNVELARFYCFTQKSIAKRLVLRQDPSVKRSVCKRCCSLLIPGVTSSVRQKKVSGRQRATVVRCLSCGFTKKLLNNPKHRLWVDRPEAQLENQNQNRNQLVNRPSKASTQSNTSDKVGVVASTVQNPGS